MEIVSFILGSIVVSVCSLAMLMALRLVLNNLIGLYKEIRGDGKA